jgi:hypothetical protein
MIGARGKSECNTRSTPEGEVRRHGCKPSAGSQAVAGRERAPAEAGADLALDKEALLKVAMEAGPLAVGCLTREVSSLC